MILIFVLPNSYGQEQMITDYELKKGLGLNLHISYIDDYSNKSKFTGFAYSNSFLTKQAKNRYFLSTLKVEYNADNMRKYPYYLFNRFGISSSNQFVYKVSNKSSLTLIGGGLKVGYYLGVRPKDIYIADAESITVHTDEGAFGVPVIYPYKEKFSRSFLSIGPQVSLNHFVPVGELVYMNLNLQYSYSLPSLADYSGGLGLFMKIKSKTE